MKQRALLWRCEACARFNTVASRQCRYCVCEPDNDAADYQPRLKWQDRRARPPGART
jgi:hypothetical protein